MYLSGKHNNAIVYAKTLDEKSYEQILLMLDQEFCKDSVIRIMPDCHYGKGCVIGLTMTVQDAICPQLIGVDIGCGMLTIKLADKNIDFNKLDHTIRNFIPNGKNIHQEAKAEFDFSKVKCSAHTNLNRASLSIGTLGGGNHFIEVSKDSNDELYLIIHTGSRKFGLDICNYYQRKALKQLTDISELKKTMVEQMKAEGNERNIEFALRRLTRKVKYLKKDTPRDLISITGDTLKNYLNDMQIAQQYASLNRKIIAAIILEHTGFSEVERFETIHNYINFNDMILRKGAVSAHTGEQILIPLNMRDGSLLCTGKGNAEWNYSAPHGAGRKMSRNVAKKTISLEKYQQDMQDIWTTCVNTATLDEAPDAYKDKEDILSVIEDTVEVVDTLKPVYNFKATD